MEEKTKKEKQKINELKKENHDLQIELINQKKKKNEFKKIRKL